MPLILVLLALGWASIYADDATFDSALEVKGNTVLGDTNTDQIIFNGRTSNIAPISQWR